jgi:hypothetical protein
VLRFYWNLVPLIKGIKAKQYGFYWQFDSQFTIGQLTISAPRGGGSFCASCSETLQCAMQAAMWWL